MTLTTSDPAAFDITAQAAQDRARRLFATNFGLASGRQLLQHRIYKDMRYRLMDAGVFSRFRHGWYRTEHASAEALRAVGAGGVVTGLNALSLRGVWVRDPGTLAIRASRQDLMELDETMRGFVLRREHVHHTAACVDPIEVALLVAILHEPTDECVIAADALLNSRTLSLHEVKSICVRAGSSGQKVLEKLDAGAGSGIETIFRLWLDKHRIAYRTQVVVDAVGRVDFLIGDRLIVEVDGWEFHGSGEQFHADRERDLKLRELGYTVVRLSYRQVMDDLDNAAGVILGLINRDEHRSRRLAMP